MIPAVFATKGKSAGYLPFNCKIVQHEHAQVTPRFWLHSLDHTLSSAQEIRLYGGYNGSNVSKAGTEQWVGRAGYQFGADRRSVASGS